MKAIAHKAFAFLASDNDVGTAPRGKTIHLRGAQHLRLRNAAGSTVRSFSGSVWITQDGDIRDIVLQAGDAFTLDRDGTVLLSPLGEARFCVTHAGHASLA